MKTDLFQSRGHCWVFQICWHIECSTFIASSFRVWNSSTGITSPSLALFEVMIPKAHLTSHSRMSGSRWSHHCGYLGHEDLFYILLLCIPGTSSSASVRSIPFLPFIVLIFAWNGPLVFLIFLKRSLASSRCQHPLDHWKSKRVPEKYLFLLYWLHQSPWLCGSQQTVESS